MQIQVVLYPVVYPVAVFYCAVIRRFVSRDTNIYFQSAAVGLVLFSDVGADLIREFNSRGTDRSTFRLTAEIQWPRTSSIIRKQQPKTELQQSRDVTILLYFHSINFLDCMLTGFSIDKKVLNFTGWRTLRKTGCYWAEEYTTSQLHRCSRAEVNKFLLA